MRTVRDIETRWGRIPGTKKARKARQRQLSLGEVVTRGGRREGAGRKPALRRKVAHVKRPLHRPYQPVHVTMRRAKGLPSFRSERIEKLIRRVVRELSARGREAWFRVIEYSIQHDHLHMIVEADEHRELSKGMRSFVIRVARRLNALLERKGHVWGDRYHRRELTCPSQVRNALVYVLCNHLKHGNIEAGEIDPFSSARWFDGWMHEPDQPPDRPTQPPTTWLLERGWQPLGYIVRGEMPRSR